MIINLVTIVRITSLVLVTSTKITSKCSLCFFGLPKQFKEIVYPSIFQNIIQANPSCDIFVHTYNITMTNNARNDEKDVAIHIEEILLLGAKKYVFDLVEDVDRKLHINDYLKYFPDSSLGWLYPTSMLHMIRQWYSIDRVWKAMESYSNYDVVGLFRLDTMFITPVSLFDRDAAVPNFGNWQSALNDRSFYGTWDNAKVWSTKRFENVEEFVAKPEGSQGLHSELYLHWLLNKYGIFVTLEPICFYRVRATGKMMDDDCDYGIIRG